MECGAERDLARIAATGDSTAANGIGPDRAAPARVLSAGSAGRFGAGGQRPESKRSQRREGF
jgi:hypothetical protein